MLQSAIHQIVWCIMWLTGLLAFIEICRAAVNYFEAFSDSWYHCVYRQQQQLSIWETFSLPIMPRVSLPYYKRSINCWHKEIFRICFTPLAVFNFCCQIIKISSLICTDFNNNHFLTKLILASAKSVQYNQIQFKSKNIWIL